MPKTLVSFDEQQILMGGEKLGDKSQDDQVEYLWSYTTSFKDSNWKKIWSKAKWTIKIGPMMWMLSTREGHTVEPV